MTSRQPENWESFSNKLSLCDGVKDYLDRYSVVWQVAVGVQ